MKEPNFEAVVKALELHADCETDNCFECPYEKYLSKENGNCVHHLTIDVLTILRESTAEIKRLKKEHADYVEDVTAMLSEKHIEAERLMREKTALECVVSTARNQGRTKAIDEFAQRVLALRIRKNAVLFVISKGNIDHIAKEMKGVIDGSDSVH